MIDIPLNTKLYDEQHIVLEKSSQQYFIKNDVNYELQMNNTIWSVSSKKKWDYSLLRV
jgi:hypothetical protein